MLTNNIKVKVWLGLVFGLVQGQVLVLGSRLGHGLDFGLGHGLISGLVSGLVYGLDCNWLGFIVAFISQVFKESIASLKCSCFLRTKHHTW